MVIAEDGVMVVAAVAVEDQAVTGASRAVALLDVVVMVVMVADK